MSLDFRDSFLTRVREAVAAGNRPGAAALPTDPPPGYQGAGADPIACFRDAFAAAGGHTHIVSNVAAAADCVLQIVVEHSARRALLGRGSVLDQLGLQERLSAAGVAVTSIADLSTGPAHDAFFAADVGISAVDFLIAETGSMALRSGRDQPRSLSLLPPLHIAVAGRSQILPDLFDLFPALTAPLPACITLITGPSKTGDIELRLVTGVHGPGEVHVVLIDA